jgi:hypothetical protein
VEHNPIKSDLPNFADLTLGAIERGEILATQPYHTTVIAQVLDDAEAREYLNIGGLVGPCGTDIASSDSCLRGIYARSELSTPTKSTTRSCSTSSTKEPIVPRRTSYSPGTKAQSPAQPPHGTSSTTRETCTAGPLQVMIYHFLDNDKGGEELYLLSFTDLANVPPDSPPGHRKIHRNYCRLRFVSKYSILRHTLMNTENCNL